MARRPPRTLALLIASLLVVALPVGVVGATPTQSSSEPVSAEAAPDEGFNVTIGHPNWTDEPLAVTATSDGGAYVLVEATRDDRSRIDLYRVDPTGAVQWSRTTPLAAGTLVADDTGAVVSGYVNTSTRGGHERWVLRTIRYAPDGDVAWSRGYPEVITYEAPEPGTTELYIDGTVTDRGIVLTGGVWYTGTANRSAKNATGWMATLGADGSIQTVHQQPGSLYAVVAPGDGSTVVRAAVRDEATRSGNSSVVVVGTNANGTVRWQRAIENIATGLAAGRNATFVTINDGFNRFLAAYAPDGSLRWKQSYSPAGFEGALSIPWTVAGVDGGALVVDGTVTDDRRGKAYLSRFDDDGDLQWSYGILGLVSQIEIAVRDGRAVIAAKDGAPDDAAPLPGRDVRLVATSLPPAGRTLPPGAGDGDLPPLRQGLAPPTDPDGDGTYEDVNGDGRADVMDVAVFLDGFEASPVQNHVSAYDFNGDGTVNILDVAELMDQV